MWSVPPVHAPARTGELQRVFLDPSLAERALGFRAVTSLEDGLRATWDWVCEKEAARVAAKFPAVDFPAPAPPRYSDQDASTGPGRRPPS